MEVDAIDAVNISVNRSKYGPPQWARIDDEHETWGVIYFLVQDIPEQRQYMGHITYRITVEHVPERRNYCHSEIRLYRDGNQVLRDDDLEREFSLLWREFLLTVAKIALRPIMTP
jgi:hypothetical protein